MIEYDGGEPIHTVSRMQQIDMWLRRHIWIDFFFVGIGGTALIIAMLMGLESLGGEKMMNAMSFPTSMIGAGWLLTRIFRLKG